MPLQRGKSRATIGDNIKTLRREGYGEKRSVAIALKEARKSGYTKNGGHPIEGTLLGSVAGVTIGALGAGGFVARAFSQLTPAQQQAYLLWEATNPGVDPNTVPQAQASQNYSAAQASASGYGYFSGFGQAQAAQTSPTPDTLAAYQSMSSAWSTAKWMMVMPVITLGIFGYFLGR
jgi:hypothetical protein